MPSICHKLCATCNSDNSAYCVAHFFVTVYRLTNVLYSAANYVVAHSMLDRALDTSDFSDIDDTANV